MIAGVLVALIAALHVYILVLEMFLWEAPRTRAIFGMPADLAAKTKAMAANQGLYNGFLAAGLVWALWLGVGAAGRDVALFFLGCVLVAGVYGGLTVMRKILVLQAAPAAFGIAAVLAGV